MFVDRYQVVGKLGFGTTSAVWLARDMRTRQYVALKIYTRGQNHDRELEICRKIGNMITNHPGFELIRSALDTFTIAREGGDHQCLVQKPMFDSFKDMMRRNSEQRFTEGLLKGGLQSALTALDFLHTECHFVHTDIKADNILVNIADSAILAGFVTAKMRHPIPRKIVSD